ncbi:MAG: hypothetical protein IJT59_00660 [Desulfovibrionaceae bacterium]|nr:hypothetical protein [Desulfovibrionaceae bacterium]
MHLSKAKFHIIWPESYFWVSLVARVLFERKAITWLKKSSPPLPKLRGNSGLEV